MSFELQLRLHKGDFLLDVDVSLPTKGIVAVCGPSGSGKTSLLRSIAGLEPEARGKLIFNGQRWQTEEQCLAPHQRRIGVVFQEPSLFTHLNVLDNIGYGRKRAGERATALALEPLLHHLGLTDLLQRTVDQLSGGERQRVAIARALAINPALLLLDEPLSGFDPTRKQEFIPYLKRLLEAYSIPIIYVSHDHHEVARLADHLLLLDRGRVSGQGSLTSLAPRLSLPLAHAQDAATILDAVVVGYDVRYALLRLDVQGDHLWLPGPQRALGERVRLQVPVTDVSVCLDYPRQSSILNVLPARLDTLMDEGNGQMLLKLLLKQTEILARITRYSAENLRLQAGQRLYVQIKSVELL